MIARVKSNGIETEVKFASPQKAMSCAVCKKGWFQLHFGCLKTEGGELVCQYIKKPLELLQHLDRCPLFEEF